MGRIFARYFLFFPQTLWVEKWGFVSPIYLQVFILSINTCTGYHATHTVDEKRKQKIPRFIFNKIKNGLSLDCLKQKWDSQVTVEVTFLFFKQEIFLDIEVKILISPTKTLDWFSEKIVENHLRRGVVEVRWLDDFHVCVLEMVGDKQNTVIIEGKNADTLGIDGGSVLIPLLHVGFY